MNNRMMDILNQFSGVEFNEGDDFMTAMHNTVGKLKIANGESLLKITDDEFELAIKQDAYGLLRDDMILIDIHTPWNEFVSQLKEADVERIHFNSDTGIFGLVFSEDYYEETGITPFSGQAINIDYSKDTVFKALRYQIKTAF